MSRSHSPSHRQRLSPRQRYSQTAQSVRRKGAIGPAVLIVAILVLVIGSGLVWKGKLFSRSEEKSSLIVEPVKRGPLEITITERGNLESANNQTLVCLVEGEAGTGILKIVDEGTRVEEGQILVELDSAKLRDTAIAQEIVVDSAKATLVTAEKNVEIQVTQNASDIAAAKLKWDLAELDLTKYQEGDYIQEKNTIKGEIELTKEDLNRAQDKYDFTQRLIKKGYAKQSEVEADRVAVAKARINFDIAKEKMEVLTVFTHKRRTAELEANATEFERELARVKLRADAALAKFDADLANAKLKYEVEKSTHERILKQIEVCTIKAPRDGMVVYVNTRSGGGRGGSEPLIYEGAKVKERQPIINLPDVKNMQVNARIHESKISMVKETFPATIHVDAMPGHAFHGVVSKVFLVPSSGNWPNINLKEYVTYIKLTDDDDQSAELKPGLTAEVEILVDRLNDVLQAPVQSFVERGGRHFAWALEGIEPVRREVKVGKSNEQVMEIVEGLTEGEKLVQTPRTVIPKELALLEEEVPATTESATSGLKAPVPGLDSPVSPGGGRRGGRGGRGSPGELREDPGEQPGSEGRGGAGGGPGGGRDPLAMFQRNDKNGDGKITEDERPERMTAERFTEMDTNKDKAVDQSEWQKGMAGRGEGRRGDRGGPPGAARSEVGGGQ